MKQVILLAITLFSLPILPSVESKHVNSLTIDLIHRDSPLSPIYNPSMTQREVILKAAIRSISRNNHFHFTADGNKAKTVVIPNNGDYLMKIFIGTPPVESLAIADTGSDLIWVQYSESCRLLNKHACGAASQCRYSLSYREKSITEGDFASGSIRFGSNDGPLITTPKTILGCDHVNTGNLKRTVEGVVGLGGGPLSLVTQLGDEIGHIFSYCLLPYTVNSTSKLKIGSESTMPRNVVGVTTPLLSKSPYTVKLEGVSVENDYCQPSQSLYIVIDSGTTLTYLEEPFYHSVEVSVEDAVEYDALLEPPEPYKLCYELDRTDFVPAITFHLSQADIHVPEGNVFVKVNGNLCLSIVPTNGTSILGNLAQMNFKVEYDLQRKTVSFAPVDCIKE